MTLRKDAAKRYNLKRTESLKMTTKIIRGIDNPFIKRLLLKRLGLFSLEKTQIRDMIEICKIMNDIRESNLSDPNYPLILQKQKDIQ